MWGIERDKAIKIHQRPKYTHAFDPIHSIVEMIGCVLGLHSGFDVLKTVLFLQGTPVPKLAHHGEIVGLVYFALGMVSDTKDFSEDSQENCVIE